MVYEGDFNGKEAVIQEDDRYGARGIWARVFWLFPLGPGAGASFCWLALIQNGAPSEDDIDAFIVLSVAAVGLVWMCLGCLWIILEGYRAVQRIEVADDMVRVELFFGRSFDIRRKEVQCVESYEVPLYKRPWTLLDRAQPNWAVRLDDGRVLLLNARYFEPLEIFESPGPGLSS